jgi:hypothetical protein
MKRSRKGWRALACVCWLTFAGCASKVEPPLYLWSTFPEIQYNTLLRSGADPVAQIQGMEAEAEKARALGSLLPPGFRAHLGMLKLSTGDAEQARTLWQAEKTAFPESAPYMDQLLDRLSAPIKKAKPT